VLLARALYGHPCVLFIDEGTAHLDPASERVIMEAINALPVTRVISAHRPLPVETATTVYLVNCNVTILRSSQNPPGPPPRELRLAGD
jgi:ATP-binding cassette subfamily B protein RaxB